MKMDAEAEFEHWWDTVTTISSDAKAMARSGWLNALKYREALENAAPQVPGGASAGGERSPLKGPAGAAPHRYAMDYAYGDVIMERSENGDYVLWDDVKHLYAASEQSTKGE